MKNFLVLAVVLTLVGCTTHPIATNQATDVPTERVSVKSFILAGSGKGSVIIKRDSGHVGNACYTKLFLDGKEIAQIDVAEKITLHPMIGEHIIGAEPKGLCGGSMSELTINVTSEKVLTYRVGYDSGVIFGLRPTAF
ncbi:hypothetical protein [Erwinia sp. Leaf53]|uniref:hypothetical protein n=1 Tax=Erwinia sp. Leaf53 TaxID=1736225 RepID=UPI0006FF62A2|nr:hypothetical protein [Erwinia sp. Leaf53]KQN63620.1 hypothetical protein ASF13_18760 [Erwinia sp. Leaf53]